MKNTLENLPKLKDEIRAKYEKFARWYDLMEGIPEVLGVRRLRHKLLQRASGKVLEIAAGTGRNLRYYPKTCRITAVDFSPAMLGVARKRGDRLGLTIPFLVMDGEALAFPDQSFDTVVSSLTLCTFSDPAAALREMARVCRADGRILLLEHGRSGREWLGRWQDRRADRHAKALGCRWNREPLDLVRQAGLKLAATQRYFFGIIHLIEASPSRPAPAYTLKGTKTWMDRAGPEPGHGSRIRIDTLARKGRHRCHRHHTWSGTSPPVIPLEISSLGCRTG